MVGLCALVLFVLSRVTYAGCFLITSPYDWNINQSVTLYWSVNQGDAGLFCVKLFNPRLLRSLLTIAVTLTAEQNSFTFTMPPVAPGDGYILSFVDISNDFHVYATSAPFSIGSSGSPPGSPSNGVGGAPPPPGASPPPGEPPPTVTIYSTVTGPDTTITLTSTTTSTPWPGPTLHSGNTLRTLDCASLWWTSLLMVPLLSSILGVI